MKALVSLLCVLALAGVCQAQSQPRPQPKPTTQPQAPKSKFVMTAAPRPVAANSHSGARHNNGYHRSRSTYFYPSNPISLTDDTSYSGSGDGYGYSRDSAVTAGTDFSSSEAYSWEPSTYMDYAAALALGKQMQAAAAQSGTGEVSLGEIARQYRAAKAKSDAAAKPQS